LNTDLLNKGVVVGPADDNLFISLGNNGKVRQNFLRPAGGK
jgi:hypothetical protein